MQDVLNFLSNCKARVASSALKKLKKDAPTPKRRIVDGLLNLFTTGYNAALETEPEQLAKQIADLDHHSRAVILEGAYAAVASRDLNLGKDWAGLHDLMAVASENVVAINEGIGHALCLQRMHVGFDPKITGTFWGWMAIDGYGCHAGYFRWPGAIGHLEVPAGLDELGLKAYNQGLGRAMWLVCAADPKTIIKTMNEFPVARRADLWSGVGMMLGCWGADDSTDMRRLLVGSGRHRKWLQTGVAFAAKGRALTGEPLPDFVREACHSVCNSHPLEAIDVADRSMLALNGPPENGAMFSRWKDLMAEEFSSN